MLTLRKRLPCIALISIVFPGGLSLATEVTQIDFVKDKAFPESQATKEKKREFAETMVFRKTGVIVTAEGENKFGGTAELSRRGPGGLGVKGNGDRNSAGEGTTSGNRVNNGEALILRFTNEAGQPLPVLIKEIVIDRIVQDTKHFPDAGLTRVQVMAGDTTVASGELPVKPGSTRGGPTAVAVSLDKPVSELRITNGSPAHPIANRFRVGAITLTPAR